MGFGLVSRYRELAPPPALASYVKCLWVQRIGDGDGTYGQPVFPDGCIDIVATGEEVMLAGPASRTTVLRLAPGALTVGVRFRTGAAPALVGLSAAELRNQDVALDALWGRSGADITARTQETPHWRGRLGIMVEALAGRLGRARVPDPVGIGIAAILAEHPRRPISLIAADVGLSERQLRRRVEDAVGYSPRLLGRILRFQQFLNTARASGVDRSLARLAIEVGYADQAHLTRESRELGGLPPAALLDWEAQRLSG